MPIIDVHSHAWQFPGDFSADFIRQAKRAKAGMEVDLSVRLEDYDRASVPGVKTIVFSAIATSVAPLRFDFFLRLMDPAPSADPLPCRPSP